MAVAAGVILVLYRLAEPAVAPRLAPNRAGCRQGDRVLSGPALQHLRGRWRAHLVDAATAGVHRQPPGPVLDRSAAHEQDDGNEW